jgi:hypothetical protein
MAEHPTAGPGPGTPDNKGPELIQFLSTKVVIPADVPDVEIITIPPPDFYTTGLREALLKNPDAPADTDLSALGLRMVVVFSDPLSDAEDVINRLTEVLSSGFRSAEPSRLQVETRDTDEIRVFVDRLFHTTSIPVSNSPIRGRTLADLLALGGSLDFQTAHLTHFGGKEVVLALLTAAGCKIVFGAADGIAFALRNGFSYHLLRMAKVPESFALRHAHGEVEKSRLEENSRTKV